MAFDIAKALGGIQPAINTRRLEKIELHLIDKNPKNLYSMECIEALADNIATVGLMEPLIVRMTPQARYMLISGHRRRAALCRLADDGRLKDGWHHKVPCMVEPDDGLILPGCPEEGEEAEEAKRLAEELKLLFANSDTRELSSADKAMQVRQLREVLSRLRDLGADAYLITRIQKYNAHLGEEYTEKYGGRGAPEDIPAVLAELKEEYRRGAKC